MQTEGSPNPEMNGSRSDGSGHFTRRIEMTEGHEEKITVIATHGGEDPERATLPFVVATAALAMDVKAVVILQANAVTLAVKGGCDKVAAPGFAPLKDLMASYASQGGKLLLCTPCIKARSIAPETLVENASPIAAARVVQECLDSKATLNY
jgi:predicted peroxiredoxin